MITFATIVIVILGGIFYLLLRNPMSADDRRKLDAEDRLAEAKIRQVEAMTALAIERRRQLPEQTRGITERYRMTAENRINAMLRQQKQEQEIEKLKAQVEILRRELGSADPFEVDEQ